MPGLLEDKILGIKPTLIDAQASALLIVVSAAVILFFGLLFIDYVMAKRVERKLEEIKREARERYLRSLAQRPMPALEPADNIIQPEFKPREHVPDPVRANEPIGSRVLHM